MIILCEDSPGAERDLDPRSHPEVIRRVHRLNQKGTASHGSFDRKDRPGPRAWSPRISPAAPGRQWWRPVVLLGLVIGILVLARFLGLADRLGELRDWIKGLGTLGALVFIVIYMAAVVAALPAAPISVAAAALFGSVWGIILINIGATLGASLAFLVGRCFARGAVVNWLGRNERFRRLDQLTEAHGSLSSP